MLTATMRVEGEVAGFRPGESWGEVFPPQAYGMVKGRGTAVRRGRGALSREVGALATSAEARQRHMLHLTQVAPVKPCRYRP